MESEPVKACLDTHAVLWSLAGDPRLGSQARALISRSKRPDLIISDVVLLEISYLSAKGRIEDADGIDALLAKVADSFRVIPISPEIARVALELDLPLGDPFDRVIAATAKTCSIPLLTRDRSISASGAVTTLW
ncbi:MAG: type II toxin-antitoxin system VapC family toxin [Luteolibacter sp.]